MTITKYKNKKSYMLIAVLAFTVLSASKCEKFSLMERFYAIITENYTSDTVYSGLGLGSNYSFNQYPDTTLPLKKPALMHIRPKNSFPFDSRKRYEEVIANLAADTLSIYFFSKSVYKDTPWSNVRSSYQVLKRYDLSKQDLIRLKWKVAYPPTVEMKNIKQFPKYGE